MERVTLYAMAVNEENAAGGRVVTAPNDATTSTQTDYRTNNPLAMRRQPPRRCGGDAVQAVLGVSAPAGLRRPTTRLSFMADMGNAVVA